MVEKLKKKMEKQSSNLEKQDMWTNNVMEEATLGNYFKGYRNLLGP